MPTNDVTSKAILFFDTLLGVGVDIAFELKNSEETSVYDS